MADFFVRNGLNPYKIVRCTITFRQIINKGEEGEPVWLIEIGTVEPHKDGGPIHPVFIHYTSAESLDLAIQEATETISKQVDWGVFKEDVTSPEVTYSYPNKAVVPINSKVNVTIKDTLPAAGVNPDSIKITVNGIDVTKEIKLIGDPYEYNLTWQPKLLVYDYE